MKKFAFAFLIVLSIFSTSVVNVFAQEVIYEPTTVVKDEIIEEVYGIYNTDPETDIMPLAAVTGLITSKSLSLAKTNDKLIISAKTLGSTDVTKCGFTYIKLQRLINGAWTDYTTFCYYDQYSESFSKSFSKSIVPPKGYTYRVVCEHYAEKTKFLVFKDKETSYNVTSSLYF